MMEKISRFITKYKSQKIKIDHHLSFSKSLKATFGAIFLALLVYSIPILLVYNLMIFPNIKWLLYSIIILIVTTFPFLYMTIYIKIIKNYNNVLNNFKFKALVIVESSFTALLLLIFTIIIMTVY